MKDEAIKKISANRAKKEEIVKELAEKFAKANAIVFTNYQGLTHKQLEGFKRAIKSLKAEYVVAKNSLLTIALTENKLKIEEGQILDGQTGTLFLYDDIISPLKELAKIIKELNLPSVKFGIMDKNSITGEQVLKLSTLPTREVLLTQLAITLKSPISGLHRALNWNLQKLVMTLAAVAKSKPATAALVTPDEPSMAKSTVEGTEPAGAEQHESAADTKPQAAGTPVPSANPTEPESIMAETKAEVADEQPMPQAATLGPELISSETVLEVAAEVTETENPTIEAEKNKTSSTDGKGGEN